MADPAAGPVCVLLRALLDILFRPKLAAARLVPLDDSQAHDAYGFFAVMAFLLVFRTWISIPMVAGAEPYAIAAGLLINNALFVGLFFWAALRWREAPSRRGSAAARRHRSAAPSAHGSRAAGCWPGRALVVLLSVTHAYGAVNLRRAYPAG